MVLCWWMALSYSLSLLLMLYLSILCVDLSKMWPNAISVKSLPHCYSIHMDWMHLFVVRSDCFRRHWHNILYSLVYCRVCSLLDSVQSILLRRVVAPLASLVSIFNCLSPLWAAVGWAKQFLSRVHRQFKSFWEIAFQIWSTVKSFSLIECHLLINIVLASYAFFLL